MGSEQLSSAASLEESGSPKSSFAKRCQALQEDLRDPWAGLQNPELSRGQCEQDLVINQVWADAIPERKSTAWRGRCAADDGSAPIDRRCRSADPLRRTCAGLESAPATARSDGAVERLRQQMPSRIQDLASLELDDATSAEEPTVGSLAVRTAARQQRLNLHRLQEQGDAPRAVWLSLHPRTGEVKLYRRSAAERLEEAYRARRSSVPLAGLGRSVDNCIVRFGTPEDGDRMVETTHTGRCRDVQRLEVACDAQSVSVCMLLEGGKWRLTEPSHAECSQDDPNMRTEKVALCGTEVAVPPSPRRLPPVRATKHHTF